MHVTERTHVPRRPCFLAVHNSSIGDLVTDSLTVLLLLTLQSDPGDLWPLRHLIRVTRKHDLTNILTNVVGIVGNGQNCQFPTILAVLVNFDNLRNFSIFCESRPILHFCYNSDNSDIWQIAQSRHNPDCHIDKRKNEKRWNHLNTRLWSTRNCGQLTWLQGTRFNNVDLFDV